ncbi:MAG: hypothetical protein WD795_02000 [Woeseia sp.]
MTLGLFDLPAPLLQWVDERVNGIVPPFVSVAMWAVFGGIVCVELYRIVSPQRRIRQIKREAKAAQQQLSGYDGEMEGAWPMIRSMLGLSLKRVGIVIPATLLAAYPIVVLVVWLSNAYGHVFPSAGEPVAVEIAPPLQARWIEGDEVAPPHIQARQPEGELVLDVPWAARVPVLHKRVWWNVLIANPAGYLPADAPVDEIRIQLPRRELHAIGPAWMRGWEAVFLPFLFVAALAYKTARHID